MDTEFGFGVDVGVLRADDLDRRMISDVQDRLKEGNVPQVLDLGCGAGGQSVRLATAGASVLAVDVVDYTEAFRVSRAAHELSEDVLGFTQRDISKPDFVRGTQFDLCCFQRTIHYVPYLDALEILQSLRIHRAAAGKLYISVTGLESDIGRAYEDSDKSVEQRFCRLYEPEAVTFRINQPVCLYTPEEFVVLLQEGEWEIEECWVSAFGNIKAVCS
jgi:SAM-dependent methyltransferase